VIEPLYLDKQNPTQLSAAEYHILWVNKVHWYLYIHYDIKTLEFITNNAQIVFTAVVVS
jgi:hypothetical protein